LTRPAGAAIPDNGVRDQFEITFLNRSASLLEEAGLGSARSILGSGRMHLVGESRAASLHRLIPLSDGRVPYLLQNHSRRRAHVERWIEELLRSSDRLSAEGVRVAEPAARGWALAREGGTMGFVIVLAPPGAVELDTTLRRVPSGRAELLREVAALVAGLHSRGVRLGRLYAWNVLVTLEVTFLLLDSGGARFAKGDRLSAAKDLAALSATIETPIVSAAQRRRFLETYTGTRGSPWEPGAIRSLWNRVDREERGLRRQGLFPRAVAVVDSGEPDGRLCVAVEWQSELADAGFRRLADFVAPKGDHVDCLRERDGRSNFVVGAAPRRYFLKVHSREKGSRKPSQGAREWENNLRLMRYGLPVGAVAAWGENRERSFFASRDRGGVPLDDLLGGRNPLLGGRNPRPRESGKEGRDLARSVGRLVRAFHGAGFFHRDLYLCHILLEEGRLVFIDLQRLEDGYLFKGRGQVKDLAALLYSSSDLPITETDRLRFLAAYLGGGRLRPSARRLIAAVRRKAARIARHDRTSKGAER